MLTISALSIITGSIISQQTLQARSETATEMQRGTERGEASAGPVGAVVGGLFGGATGLVRDTENVVTGKTAEERAMRESSDDMDMTYDESEMSEPQSNTATEMERGTEHGEEVAGPVGAAVGGLFGAGVGLAEDTGDFVTGKTAKRNDMQNQEEDIFMTYEGPSAYDEDMDLIPRDVSHMDHTLTIDEVE
jgi:hypothetical protein